MLMFSSMQSCIFYSTMISKSILATTLSIMLPLMCFGLGGLGVVHGPHVDVVEYGPQVVVSAGDGLGVVESGLVVVT